MIEISGRINTYIYRLAPKDATVIERRTNRANARWYFFSRHENAEDARKALLRLEKADGHDD